MKRAYSVAREVRHMAKVDEKVRFTDTKGTEPAVVTAVHADESIDVVTLGPLNQRTGSRATLDESEEPKPNTYRPVR